MFILALTVMRHMPDIWQLLRLHPAVLRTEPTLALINWRNELVGNFACLSRYLVRT